MAILSPGAHSFSFAGLRKSLLPAAVAAFVMGAGPANAQFFDRPAADNRDQGAQSADTASILRIDRLENQVRALNGQVEQLQFQVKRLDDQLRKFQLDVDARFQDSSAKDGIGKPAPARPAAAAVPQRRTELQDGDIGAAPVPAVAENDPPETEAPVAVAPAAAVSPDGRRHDAFDPSAQPSAPGAPQELGSADSASKPLPRTLEARAAAPTGPLDLTPPALRGAPASAPDGAASSSVATLSPQGQGIAPATNPADPIKAEYDSASELLKSQHYDAAQQAFAAFVQKNPHSRLIAPATYHLGESYYYQNRHREAAEQFLRIATDYSKSPVAPDAMVKLGVSLNALGAKEQACAFFSEMPRKYPNAPPAQKLAAEREAKKASC
jgi:tol-pal system protein YbgF